MNSGLSVSFQTNGSVNRIKHSFCVTRAKDNSKEILNFFVLENMRVEYPISDVIQVVVMAHFKILPKHSRQNQLQLSFERKVGQSV